MIGMVLVTHGRLAAEFIAALEHVVGPQTNIAAICIGPVTAEAAHRVGFEHIAVATPHTIGGIVQRLTSIDIQPHAVS